MPSIRRVTVLFAAWTSVTLLLPTVMQTKLPWYLNPFYPLFALAVGAGLAGGFRRLAGAPRWRRNALAAVAVLMFAVAEGKFVWYSYNYRQMARSDQALLVAHRERLTGRVVFRDRQDAAGFFVARAIVGADARYAADLEMFLSQSQVDDYFVTSSALSHADVEWIGSVGGVSLYRRYDATPGPAEYESWSPF